MAQIWVTLKLVKFYGNLSQCNIENLIQTLKFFIFSCSHCSCTIFILTSYSLYTQVMLILILMDVQYLHNVVFRMVKNHSLPDSHQPIKKSSPQQNFPLGGNFSLPLNAIWKTLCKVIV